MKVLGLGTAAGLECRMALWGGERERKALDATFGDQAAILAQRAVVVKVIGARRVMARVFCRSFPWGGEAYVISLLGMGGDGAGGS